MLVNQSSFESSASLRSVESFWLSNNKRHLGRFRFSFLPGGGASLASHRRFHDVLCRCSSSGRFARLKLRHLEKHLTLHSPAQTM